MKNGLSIFAAVAIMIAATGIAPAQKPGKRFVLPHIVKYAVTVLHPFDASQGSPTALGSALIRGKDGNFYGTTGQGGPDGEGIIFRVSPAGAFTTFLSHFGGRGGPNCLIQADDGPFYGTTSAGGDYGNGSFIKVSSSGYLITLHSFNTYDDGGAPNGLCLSNDGSFYGTTLLGGSVVVDRIAFKEKRLGGGTIFKVDVLGSC